MIIKLRFPLMLLALPVICCITSAATITWTNVSGGNWNLPANWSPNQVPGGNDIAIFSTPGSYNVFVTDTESVSNLVLGAASGTLTLNLSGGAFTVNGTGRDSAQSALVISGGTVNGTGSIVVGGPLTWDGGSIYNTVHFNGGSQSSSLNLYGGILVNTGTFDWNGTIFFYTGSTLTNLASGTINLASGASAQAAGGNNLDNDGQFNVPGPGTTSVTVPFNNFGTVAVSSGTLTLTDGGTETGLFTNAAAGTLDLGGGTFTLNAGSSVVGAGNFMVSSGTANLAGSMDIEGTSTFSGGTANVTGACTITNVLVISGGTLNLNGTGPITPVTATISGGAEAGSQTLQVLESGGFTWEGGNISGTVHFNGGSQSSSLNLYGGILVNTGTFDWNGTIFFYTGSTLTNLASGTINLASGASAQAAGGNNLDNDGQFNVPGPGTTSVTVPFNNFGTVAVSSGTLTLTDGGTETGLFTNAAAGTLDLGGGTFTLNAGSSVVGAGNFMVSSGTANLAGSMDIEGTSTFSGGTANVTGACTITNVLVISGGTLNLNGTGPITPVTATISGGAEAGSQTLQVLESGGFTWEGGNISGTVHFNGGSQSSSLNLYGGILVNTGTFDWNGTIFFYTGSTLTNLASGTINLASGASAQAAGGNNLDNDGQFNVPGPGTTSVTVPFNNFGTVAVSSGTLTLTDGGTETGLFTNAAAGTLDLGGGTFTLNAGSSVVGAGNFMVSSGTANLAGSMDIEGTSTFSGGTANVTGACTITNVLVISGGTLNLNGTGPITPVTATISGGAEAGSQTLQVLESGGFTWEGGNISGTVHFNGGSQSSSLNLYGGILVNTGTFDWNGTIFFYTGSTLTNLASGTINLASGASAQAAGGNNLDNDGQFNVPGPGTTSVTVPFNNFGTVAVSSGTLTLTDGGTETGLFTNAAAGTLDLGGGTFTLNAGSSVVGAGNFMVSSGTANLAGSMDIEGTSTFSGGTANVTGACTITNVLVISGGTLNLNGTGPITPVTATISGGAEAGSQTLQVLESGGFTWEGGNISGTVHFNGGSQSSSLNLYGGILVNTGTFDWNGTIFFYTGSTLTNLASGTINLASGASAQAAGGNNLDNDGQFNVPGPGTTSVTVPFNNTGTLNIQSGTLSFPGGYTSTNGTLNFGISSTTSFAQLALSGPFALNGNLGVIAKGYIPEVDDSFPLITYGSEAGIFNAFNLPNGADWIVNYGTTAFSINVESVKSPFITLEVANPTLPLTDGFEMLLLGPIGSNYTVQASTDLKTKDWKTFTNFTTSDSSFYFTDTGATNYSNRFYRAYMQ